MSKKLAIIPGIFNPLHLGHLNLIEKAERIFGKDSVVVCVELNPDLSNIENGDKAEVIEEFRRLRVSTIKSQIPSREVDSYIGLLSDFVFEKEQQGFDVTAIIGVRSQTGFGYELDRDRYLWDAKPDLKIIYIPCDPIFSHLSSSKIREMEKIKAGSAHDYIAREK